MWKIRTALRSGRGRRRAAVLAIVATVGLSTSARAQVAERDASAGRLTVFVTCSTGLCNSDTFRERIPWVNWVQSAEEAQLHVTIAPTAQGVAPSGYALTFEGSGDGGLGTDQLGYDTQEGDGEVRILERLTSVLSIGFARFGMIAGLRDVVALRPAGSIGPDANERVVSAEEVDDPWNLWTFRVGGNGNVSGQETRQTRRFSGNFSANRTTPTWRLSFNGRGTINIREFELSNGSNFRSDQKDWSFTTATTYALADHWSARLSSASGKHPTANQDFRQEVLVGIEYSMFPYVEATRRSLTARYTIGPTYRNYEEETVFGELEEIPWEHTLQLRATMRQPWGDASSTATMSHLLDDIDKHGVILRGNVSFRIVRGLSFNTGGNVSWVTDQVYISAGGVTDEEILLALRTRASAFNYGMNLGFSYQFGSIYNNTVNNRFSGGEAP